MGSFSLIFQIIPVYQYNIFTLALHLLSQLLAVLNCLVLNNMQRRVQKSDGSTYEEKDAEGRNLNSSFRSDFAFSSVWVNMWSWSVDSIYQETLVDLCKTLRLILKICSHPQTSLLKMVRQMKEAVISPPPSSLRLPPLPHICPLLSLQNSLSLHSLFAQSRLRAAPSFVLGLHLFLSSSHLWDNICWKYKLQWKFILFIVSDWIICFFWLVQKCFCFSTLPCTKPVFEI